MTRESCRKSGLEPGELNVERALAVWIAVAARASGNEALIRTFPNQRTLC